MFNILALGGDLLAAPAPATALPTAPPAFNATVGIALVVMGLAAQVLISKRLRNPKVAKVYSWIAWISAMLGGVGVTSGIIESLGLQAGWATIAACAMLLFIIVDLADRRPDWPAFILIVFAPSFMRASGGTLGDAFRSILSLGDALLGVVAGLLGF